VVHGNETEFFRVRNVPHGEIHRHFYHNPAIESVRSCRVYVPPGYGDHPEKRYPVLFLLHGSGGTDESWFREGKANVIMDNLIADGQASPMIVVTPYGHTVEPGTHGWPFVQEQGDFIEDFLWELIPYLKSKYRLSQNPYDWALAGFSMGGYHTLMIGLNHPELFGNIGPFSWGGGADFFEKNAPHVLVDPESMNRDLQTFYMACGKYDFLFNGVVIMDSLLTSLGIEHEFHISEGGHNMRNWRKYLYHYAQILFRD
jgi:enterochelin esterase family protein